MKFRLLGSIATLAMAAVFAVPPAPAAEEPAKATTAAKKKKKPKLSKRQAERQYQHAQELEKKGDQRGALAAYLAAGESGHGMAQKRLGEIYEKGNSATKRDYDTALRWYEKARAQGIEIPKPIVLPRGH